ncbi:MAG: NusA-like transcription termination signal-binding factor [archaeon]
MIKLTSQEMKFITLFEKITKSTVKDCIIKGDELTFIVKEGDMGLAIGKKGVTINKIKKQMGKEIHVYEHSEDPKKFIQNLFFPVKIEKIEIEGEQAKVYMDPELKKRAIGKEGKKINTVKELASRHYPINEIKIM